MSWESSKTASYIIAYGIPGAGKNQVPDHMPVSKLEIMPRILRTTYGCFKENFRKTKSVLKKVLLRRQRNVSLGSTGKLMPESDIRSRL